MAAEESYRAVGDLFKQITEKLNIKPVLRNITDIPNILRTAYFEKMTVTRSIRFLLWLISSKEM